MLRKVKSVRREIFAPLINKIIPGQEENLANYFRGARGKRARRCEGDRRVLDASRVRSYAPWFVLVAVKILRRGKGTKQGGKERKKKEPRKEGKL